MNQFITTHWKLLREDRLLFMQALLLVIVGFLYVLYASLSLSPTDLQTATRYTAFGGTQYYRNKWYYLIGFVIFGFVMLATHIGLMLKLKSRGMRALAVGLGWLSLLMFGLLFFYAYSVFGAAYLS